jgi:1-acyl-sn-glycerol-3-phosphate acyltransferase
MFFGGIPLASLMRDSFPRLKDLAAQVDQRIFENASASLRDWVSHKEDTLEAIHQSITPNAPVPRQSLIAGLQLVRDYLHLASIANLSFQRDSSGQLYDNVIPDVALAFMQRLQSQPRVLHPARLQELRHLQEQGCDIIIVPNHRSWFDIPVLISLLRDLSPRFVVKDELHAVPALGWSPLHQPLAGQSWKERWEHWKDDGVIRRAKHIAIDRDKPIQALKKLRRESKSVFKNGHALVIFAEETRYPTPNRRREFGMKFFESGVFAVAQGQARQGRKVLIVPVALYGLGELLPKDIWQDLLEGPTVNQPIVLSIGESIDVASVRESFPGLKRGELAMCLNLITWHRLWQELAGIQTFMNGR